MLSTKVNIAEEFAKLAKHNQKKIDIHGIEDQYEQRMKRSGLLFLQH